MYRSDAAIGPLQQNVRRPITRFASRPPLALLGFGR